MRRRAPAGLGILLLASLLLPPVAVAAKPQAHPGPGRYRFTAPAGATLLVHGTYPQVTSGCAGPVEQPLLHERYRGSVEVVRSSDGDLYLVGELPFEDYLKGIAEVPRDWPLEALKAQVVAARTYAMSRLDPGGEYDLCATDACQVYVGAGIEMGAWGRRWARAVEETRGQVLTYGGKPASTYYFSTSNGRTYDNEDVFGGGPAPYLRGVVERDDGASPLAHWTVRVPLADLARFLAASGRWSGRPIRLVRQDDGHILVRGSRKRSTLTMDRAGLRDALNDSASCLEPSRYPSREPGGYRLPQTVPSTWFTSRQEGDALVIEGRGWGHGVGMVQWGAFGKARRGMGYGDILAAYYGGLRPRQGDVPGTIRVLLATDLTSVTVVPSDAAKVGGGQEAPSPPWRLTGGRRLRLHHGSLPPPVLTATGLDGDSRARTGAPLHARVRISSSARVRLVFSGAGETVAETPWQPFDEGVARIELPAPPLGAGRYEVRAVATDGVDRVRSAPAPLRVSAAAPAPLPPSPATRASPEAAPAPAPGWDLDTWLTVIGVVVGALVLLGLLLTLHGRIRLPRP